MKRFKVIPLLISGAIGLILLGSGLAVWKLPQRQIFGLKQQIEAQGKSVDPERLFALENASRANVLKIVQAFGALGFLLTGYFAWRRLDTAGKSQERANDQQVTQRFSQAVQLLSETNKLEARIGGIYLLESVTQESLKDGWAVMEVLSTYIREKSPANWREEIPYHEGLAAQEIATDVQAALKVIARCPIEYDHDRILDLTTVNLSGASLAGANLRRVNFSGSVLVEADLSATNLSEADFSGANLIRANLTGANLTEANLAGANLIGANLSDANLDGADLRDAIDPYKVTAARNWKSAKYDDDFREQLGLTSASMES